MYCIILIFKYIENFGTVIDFGVPNFWYGTLYKRFGTITVPNSPLPIIALLTFNTLKYSEMSQKLPSNKDVQFGND